MLDRYVAQVRLLLSVLPDIATETAFALKGGTAINLFYRDMPRLSVDVDLTYLSRNALADTGRRLHAGIKSRLKDEVAGFLLSLHDAAHDFGPIGLPEAGGLPAVRWELISLEKLKQADPEKHAVQRRALESLFE